MIKLSYRKKYRNRTLVIITLVISMLALTGCTAGTDEVTWKLEEETTEQTAQTADEVQEADGTDEIQQTQTVCVYVCGAVANAGVYELPEGSRLYEAIALAGGMTDEADEAYLNLAQTVMDGEQILVPTIEEAAQLQSSQAAVSDGLVNINTAGVSQLTTLSGIGESRAEAIIEYREEHGAFTGIEEIKNVSGIKDALFEKIKDQITVG